MILPPPVGDVARSWPAPRRRSPPPAGAVLSAGAAALGGAGRCRNCRSSSVPQAARTAVGADGARAGQQRPARTVRRLGRRLVLVHRTASVSGRQRRSEPSAPTDVADRVGSPCAAAWSHARRHADRGLTCVGADAARSAASAPHVVTGSRPTSRGCARRRPSRPATAAAGRRRRRRQLCVTCDRQPSRPAAAARRGFAVALAAAVGRRCAVGLGGPGQPPRPHPAGLAGRGRAPAAGTGRCGSPAPRPAPPACRRRPPCRPCGRPRGPCRSASRRS